MEQRDLIALLHKIDKTVAVIEEKVNSIEVQTTKTNGRVDKAHERLDAHDKIHATNQGKTTILIALGSFIMFMLGELVKKIFF